jgi:hypothetical protein
VTPPLPSFSNLDTKPCHLTRSSLVCHGVQRVTKALARLVSETQELVWQNTKGFSGCKIDRFARSAHPRRFNKSHICSAIERTKLIDLHYLGYTQPLQSPCKTRKECNRTRQEPLESASPPYISPRFRVIAPISCVSCSAPLSLAPLAKRIRTGLVSR